jgi:hypothetical protein
MMSKGDEVRTVQRSTARAFRAKSQEFMATAREALADGKADSAGLNAIHAGIAAADSALIASAGIRSTSQDHGVVIILLEQHVPEFSATQRRQMGGLLKMKNQVAYEQRLLTTIEARQLVDQASRLTRWATMVVASHLGD